MAIKTLPYEIVKKIIEFGDCYSQYECLDVCTLWSTCATAAYYENFKMDNVFANNPSRSIQLRRMGYHMEHNDMVKTLVMGSKLDICTYPDRLDLIAWSFSSFKNLNTIELPYDHQCHEVFKVLRDPSVELKNLRSVIFNWFQGRRDHATQDLDLIRDYISTLYKFRNSIGFISLDYFLIVKHYAMLSKFTNLTQLEMYLNNRNEVYEYENTSSIFKLIMSTFPHLTDLYFKGMLQSESMPVKKEVYYREQMISPNEANTIIKHLNANHHSYNQVLKYFTVFSSTVDASQIDNIISYIPTSHMKNIDMLLSGHRTLDEWIKKIDQKTILKFARHIGKSVRLEFFITPNFSTLRVPTHEEVMQVHTLLWLMAKSMDEDRNFHSCCLKLSLLEPPLENSLSDKDILVKNKELTYHSAVTRRYNGLLFRIKTAEKSIEISQTIYYDTFFDNHYMDLDTKCLINSCFAKITKEIKMHVPSNRLIEGLKFILRSFPIIKHIQLYGPACTNLRIGETTHERLTCSKTHQSSEFDRVRLEKILITEDLIDTIASLFPSIAMLEMHMCLIPDKFGRRFYLDLTAMPNLKSLDIDINDITLIFPTVFITTTNTEKQNMYYYHCPVNHGTINHLRNIDLDIDLKKEYDSPSASEFHINIFHEKIQTITFGDFKMQNFKQDISSN